jgi:potassium-transporting ATPase KdpC subunit
MEKTMTENKEKRNFKPTIGLTLISLLICGLFFPILVTGIAQVFFPYQANGEIVQLNGKDIGSNLIAQTFSLPIFFHPRNDSASGVDPDITLKDAYSQVPGISNATGISSTVLTSIVDHNQEGTLWIFGSPYVNVLRVNLELIREYPSAYGDFSG